MAKKSTTECPRCGSHYWEYEDLRFMSDIDPQYSQPTATCSNCCYTRNWTPRTPSQKITPSQQAKIDRIKRYFQEDKAGRYATPEELEAVPFKDFEVEALENGKVYINVLTEDHVLVARGLHGYIGTRGHLDVIDARGSYSNYKFKNEAKKHYQRYFNRR